MFRGAGRRPGEGGGGAVNPSTAFGLVLADELARCGLREVVVAPGSRSTPLAMAFWELDQAGRVRLHVRVDERSAAFTALGLAKASRRPVAVLCTSGTAAANFHPAVIEADESAVPLLVLTADRPPELRGTGASQTVDQVKLYGSAVRWYAESGVPERRPGLAGYWRSLACRAWAHAAGAPGTLPGPVHLNLPFRDPLVPDVARPPSDNSNKRVSAGTLPRARGAADARPVDVLLADNDWPDSLAGRPDGAPWTRVAGGGAAAAPLELPWAERGVVVCGDGDYDAAALVELAERAGWPVLAEPSSGARRGPGALAGYQYLLASPRFMAEHRPEVIVSAGRPGLTRPQSALLALAGAGRDAGASGTSSSPPGPGCGPTRSAARPTSRRRSGSPGRPPWCPAAGSAHGGARTRRRRGPRARYSMPGPPPGTAAPRLPGRPPALPGRSAVRHAAGQPSGTVHGALSEPGVARELVSGAPGERAAVVR